ncbi:MAG: polyprenyl synthetase family protein [Candidatus Saganbacteria bacterium]|nr:polyprenyl synthetase family protein [Candidatus Saganbacteria bacterium]
MDKYLKAKQKTINQALKKWLPPKNKSTLTRAMHYSVFAGGKRFRPILMLAVADALGHDPKKILPFACAIELVHTFTLIHDDLPAMDNDDYRRGKPTCHRVFGEDMAILTGDALHALAFEIIASQNKFFSSTVLLAMVKELASALGVEGVTGGQVKDLEAEGKNISLKELYAIHNDKTARLIVAAVTIAAMACSSRAQTRIKLADYARHLGLTFQIKDDILDQVATFKTLGKKPKGDIKNKKATFPGLMGLDTAKKRAKEEAAITINAVSFLGEHGKILRFLVEYIVNK